MHFIGLRRNIFKYTLTAQAIAEKDQARRYPRYPQQPLSIAFLRSAIRTTIPVACLFMVAMIEPEDLYVVEDAQDSCAASSRLFLLAHQF
jgi:hypothetical protein